VLTSRLMASEIGVEEEDLVPVPLIGRAPPFRASIKSIWASSNKLASCLFSPTGRSARLFCAWLSRFDVGDLLGFPNLSPHFGRGLLLFAI